MATLDALFEGIVANDKGLVNVAAKAVDRHGKVMCGGFYFLWLLHHALIILREGTPEI